jgi:hypothetical protein
MNDYGAIWLVQFSGRDILLLDYHTNENQGAAHYVGKIKEWEREHGVGVRTNYLPHDANQRSKGTGKTYIEDMVEAGMPNNQIRVVTRIPDKWLGINALRALLKRAYMHTINCNREHKSEQGNTLPSGVQCLDFYRKKVTLGMGGAMFEDPVHDIYSNGADALRTFAEAYRQGMLEGGSAVSRETRTPGKVLRGPGPQSYPGGTYRQKAMVLR